jgi:hypothetical protein
MRALSRRSRRRRGLYQLFGSFDYFENNTLMPFFKVTLPLVSCEH